jgi:glycosyltransferase involved in cell wall biosynthesis
MWIYLSPHLDDVAYSCGGLLWTQTRAGEEVSVWTLFAGDPPAGELSPFARHMHQRWAMTERSFGGRRTEDRESCVTLGADYRHDRYNTCLYRRGGRRNRFLYPTPKHMFGNLSRRDAGLAKELAGDLSRALPAEVRVVAPLGLGNHVDHVLTRLVAERLGRPLWYYEDFPYALQEPDKNDQVLDSAWESEVFPVSAAALEAWQAAVAAHGSQIEVCWNTESDMREALSRHLKRVGGVRLWRRKSARPVRDAGAGDGRSAWLLVPHQMAPMSPALPMGGGVSSMIDLAEGLHRAGVDVTLGGHLHEETDYCHNGVAYRHLAADAGAEQNLSLLSDQGFDVIVAHRGHVLERSARYFPFAVKILRVIDLYLRTHRVPPQAINRRADAVIAVSRFVKDALSAWGIREQKIGVIANGLRTNLFFRNPDTAREDNLIVSILVEACDRLMEDDPDLRLEVYGSVGLWRQREEVLDWRKITSRSPNIVYKGATAQEDLAQAFNRASLCVVPSDPKMIMEGFGRVSLEAQGCGCPVVVSRSGGLPETMVEGETGIIVDPLDAETLAEAIRGLLADKEKRAAMSLRAEQHARRFTVDEAARTFLGVAAKIRDSAAIA